MFNNTDKLKGWKASKVAAFWGQVASSDHVVQIYENEKTFMDLLEGFVVNGFIAGDSTIIIATAEHLRLLNVRLEKLGFYVNSLIVNEKYIPLDANETLSKFMVDGWPDEKLFTKTITQVLGKARAASGKVRAFGEMVAILWAQDQKEATLHLEKLWEQLHAKDNFSLYCAYPKEGFLNDSKKMVDKICCSHAKIIIGAVPPSSEIFYKNTA